jgi:AcrR family transcriptional regulator
MVMIQRERTPSAQIEPAIVAAATILLEREGPDALSIRRIASEAGVAPMGVYNHFESKAGVIDALFRSGFERLGQALASLDLVVDPYVALLEAGRRYRSLAIAHPEIYRLMFMRSIHGYEPTPESKLVALEAFAGLARAVVRGNEAGVIEVDDTVAASQVIWSAIHGWVSLEIDGMQFCEDPELGVELLCRAVVDGLGSDSTRIQRSQQNHE